MALSQSLFLCKIFCELFINIPCKLLFIGISALVSPLAVSINGILCLTVAGGVTKSIQKLFSPVRTEMKIFHLDLVCGI